MLNAPVGKAEAVEKFQQYLRINTSHPNPQYGPAVTFLHAYANEIGLDVSHIETGQSRSLVTVMKWQGLDPTLPSLLLNSHIDTAPASERCWKHNPWAGVKDEHGNIYGRGAQDMKSVGVQYLEAIRTLKKSTKQFVRTIYLTFMPDEQSGGFDVKQFWDSDHFKGMNVGLVLDEGLPNPSDAYSVFYAERVPWWVEVKCKGEPGIGAMFQENSAAQKLRKVINIFADFEDSEKERMTREKLPLGGVCTVTLTAVSGGELPNAVPTEMLATFDIRIPPSVDLDELESKIKSWCRDAGDDVTYKFLQKLTSHTATDISNSNPWWKSFTDALTKTGIRFTSEVFPCFSDSRYLRERGYQAIGFSPIRRTPILLHKNDEHLNEEVFVEGIKVYCCLVAELADLPSFTKTS